MGTLLQPDWGGMFFPKTSLPEIFLRGTLVYLGLFVLLRVVLKRQAGNVSLTDLLLIVLVADACQNAMANEYKSISEGFVLVATLIFWDYALDWLAYHFPKIRSLVHPLPLLLIRNGHLQEGNLRKELITEEQLQSQLRQHGVDDLRQVQEAFMEGDGHISVVEKEKQPQQTRSAEVDPQPGKNQKEAPAVQDEETELHPFLDAVRVLRETMEQHHQRVAEHEAHLARIKEALARHGFRASRLAKAGRKAQEERGETISSKETD